MGTVVTTKGRLSAGVEGLLPQPMKNVDTAANAAPTITRTTRVAVPLRVRRELTRPTSGSASRRQLGQTPRRITWCS